MESVRTPNSRVHVQKFTFRVSACFSCGSHGEGQSQPALDAVDMFARPETPVPPALFQSHRLVRERQFLPLSSGEFVNFPPGMRTGCPRPEISANSDWNRLDSRTRLPPSQVKINARTLLGFTRLSFADNQTGRSSAWLERLLWEQEVACSNHVVPTQENAGQSDQRFLMRER